MTDDTDLNLEEFGNTQAPPITVEGVEDEHETLGSKNGDVGAVYNVPVQVSAVLGRATMPVSQLLKLGRGAVVELDRRVGEAIDIYVNNRLVARGEIVVMDDRLGITMTEIIKAERS
jgi:flagellar motor switch protein FliN/FliY